MSFYRTPKKLFASSKHEWSSEEAPVANLKMKLKTNSMQRSEIKAHTKERDQLYEDIVQFLASKDAQKVRKNLNLERLESRVEERLVEIKMKEPSVPKQKSKKLVFYDPKSLPPPLPMSSVQEEELRARRLEAEKKRSFDGPSESKNNSRRKTLDNNAVVQEDNLEALLFASLPRAMVRSSKEQSAYQSRHAFQSQPTSPVSGKPPPGLDNRGRTNSSPVKPCVSQL
ncbi:hypothetical protein Ciccas_003332 [Cichlidogyrus casuarinus]|uniref:Uncharacterized protein n=1 Tax=Cichlidogyrus casuarinus TaxID=1844966 RepID=A0ABD2QFD0_9PLAT